MYIHTSNYKDKKGTKGLYTYRETADSFFKA